MRDYSQTQPRIWPQIWPNEIDHLQHARPEAPVLYFAPERLADTARRFAQGFDGMTTYAVKANPERAVLDTLVAAGVTGFDVASPAEIALVRDVAPGAALHYNNLVRSPAEIAAGVAAGVASWSVDGLSELAKLIEQVPQGTEVAVRLALPVSGAAYDFGSKFGEAPEGAARLLRAVAKAGFTPAMTFHPGTQCADPSAWARYIETCADIAEATGVRLARLNVGGGFPAATGPHVPPLEAVFDAIHSARDAAFGPDAPRLVCEPGRAMVAGAFSLATRVKAKRECGSLFLNDGIYGLLAEVPLMGLPGRVRVVAPDGSLRDGAPMGRVLYGPTCDSLDRLPQPVDLPGDVEEGDYLIFDGIGAYSTATATGFNGYGAYDLVTIRQPAP